MNGSVNHLIDISNQESWFSGSIQNLTTKNLGKEYNKYYRLKCIIDKFLKNKVELLQNKLKIMMETNQRKISNLYLLKKIIEQTDYSIDQDVFIQATKGQELDLTMFR